MKLEKEIIQWAEDREIFKKATPITQHNKTVEEVLELRDAIIQMEENGHPSKEIVDGIGDTIVTLVILCKMYKIKIDDCVAHAYNEIKDRKGQMIDGQFVKGE